MNRTRLPIALLAVALFCGAGPDLALRPPGCEMKDLARDFATSFLQGDHERNRERMTATMQDAFGPGVAEQHRQALVARNGAVSQVGEPWMEDTVVGYLRLRVPVRFELTTLDFRVVLDQSSRVAGFFIVAHVDPPEGGRERELQIGDHERGIPATLTVPSGKGPFPAAVLIHGSGPQDRDETIGPNKPFRDLAWGLAERGVAVLRYDKRSYARPQDLVAAGQALTVRQEVIEDARAAIALLGSLAEIDGERIYVVGHSLGGTLLPRVAAEGPRPAGLISLAGATLPLPEKVLEQTRYIASVDGEVSETEQAQLQAIEKTVRALRDALEGQADPPEGYLLGAPVGYFRDLEAHDAAAEAAALGLPILVLQGERDYQVTMEDFARWTHALADKPFACLLTYENLDHLFRSGSGPSQPRDYERAGMVDPRVIDDIAAWIETCRCPDQAG